MTHVDLFSGIGGFALAARWAGIKTVQFVEIDKFCHKVLNKNFPGVPIHDDIKTFTYANKSQPGTQPGDNEEMRRFSQEERKSGYGSTLLGGSVSGERPLSVATTKPFILTGGFPCQPFSCAGKRKGKEDDRALWPEMLRVISEAKPHWVIGENVAGFIGMGLDDCISDLEREGYEVQTFVIPACAVNAPHRRDRVWIVANRSDSRVESLRRRENSILQNSHASDTINEGCIRRSGRSNTDKDGIQESEQARGKCKLSEGEGQMQTSGECWSEPWLEVATRLCRVDDGLPRQLDRVNRLKALGNAIVPQVAYQIMKAIVETDRYGV